MLNANFPKQLPLPSQALNNYVLEPAFYASWIVLRCAMYPYLAVCFYGEWRQYSADHGTPWNPLLAGPLLQVSKIIIPIT